MQLGYCPTTAVNARGRGQCFSHMKFRIRGRSTRIKNALLLYTYNILNGMLRWYSSEQTQEKVGA